MSVTQINTLKAIELVKNAIPINMLTDTYITTPGETAWIDILVNSKDNNSDYTFQLAWSDKTLVFTSKVTPDDSGLQFRSGAAFASITLWLDAVVEDLAMNETLSNDFRIWHVNDHLYFESYEKSDTYTLAFSTPDFDWSEDSQNDGVDQEIEINYMLVVSVYAFIEVRGDLNAQNFDYFEKVKAYEIEPLIDATASIQIQEAISPYFLPTTLPNFDASGPYKVENLLHKYFYRYSEKFGSPSVQQSTNTSGVLLALNGGINRKDFDDESFYDDIINGVDAKFLSWHPLNKRITKEQYDFLHWIQVDGPLDLHVRYIAIKADGSSATVDVQIFFNEEFDVHGIPVHYSYVSDLFSSDLISVTVQMIDNFPTVTYFSEVRTFEYINNSSPNAKNYIYKNSLGVYEGYAFTGEIQKGVEVSKLSTTKILQLSDNEQVNEVIYGDINFNIETKATTGFRLKEDLHAFIEFVKSESIYEQTATYYKPVTIKSDSVKLYEEEDNISSATVTLLDNTEKNYSNA